MDYNKLFCIFPWAFYAAFIIDGLICGIKQHIHWTKCGLMPNIDRLYIILYLPIFITIMFILYYI
jgi:hypothetical protein